MTSTWRSSHIDCTIGGAPVVLSEKPVLHYFRLNDVGSLLEGIKRAFG